MDSPVVKPPEGPVARKGANPIKIAMIAVLVICGILAVWNLGVRQKLLALMLEKGGGMMPPISVAAKPVTLMAWSPGIEAVGTARAFQGADLASEADGNITAIDAVPQTKVATGQRLIQIDDAVEQADLNAAKATLRLKETSLSRSVTLTRQGVTAQAALDDARSQLDLAKAAIAKIQAQIDQKVIKAPFEGTVGIPRVNVGQYVTKGTVLVTLQDIDRIYVDFTLPEQTAGAVKLGQTVRFGTTAQAFDFTGTVTGIDPKVDPQTRLVPIRAEVSDAKGRLLPGQFLRLRIDLPEEQNVMALPATAVASSLYGEFVYVVAPKEGAKGADADPAKRGVIRQVMVKVGRRFAGLIEVKEGLKPGQVVVVAGQNKIHEGAAVAVDNTIDYGKLTADAGAPR